MIAKCHCTRDLQGNTAGAAYQDLVYGRGNRIHNPRGKGHEREMKCTICATVKTFTSAAIIEDAPKKKSKKGPKVEAQGMQPKK